MAIEFGLSLLAGPPKGQIGKWQEDLAVVLPQIKGKVGSLWMTDHFFWEDKPTYEAWTVLCYLAAQYPDFKLGPIVLGQTYRNPALLAKMAATLQVLSGGRFIMGIGAAWKEDEHHAYGFPYPSPGVRLEQLEDTIEIMKRMWTEPGPVTYHGKQYHVKNAWCEPRPDPVPELLIGGGGRKTMLLAARYGDYWNLPDSNYAKYTDRLAILKEHCANIGRDMNTLRLSWFGRLALGKTEADAVALSDGKWTKDNAFAGTPQQVIDQIGPFLELGVDHFIVEVLGLPDEWVMRAWLEDVQGALIS